MSDSTRSDLQVRAHAGVDKIAAEYLIPAAHTFGRETVHNVAAMAWLDGYRAGHRDATKRAVEAIYS